MANSNKPLAFAAAAVAVPGTSVSPSTAVPDNCVALVIYNASTTETLYHGIGSPGGALTPGVDAQPVPPGGSLTLTLGDVGDRGIMDEAESAGSGLVFDATGAMTAYIEYQNRLGY